MQKKPIRYHFITFVLGVAGLLLATYIVRDPHVWWQYGLQWALGWLLCYPAARRSFWSPNLSFTRYLLATLSGAAIACIIGAVVKPDW